ncbi:uncharacterized protein [Halyomorpha halys]|uniref:uncharacterized protein n=1 Tax=Halyomorpha halys TaxID=286706 RepID=UPI0006D4FBE6|nr:uncharacterized protein LOC106680200 [Halyomorpha halys]
MNNYDWTIDWNYENLTKLIELYGKQPALWDPTNSDYQAKDKKNDAWKFLANEMGCEINEVKSKMTSLLSSYRREKMKTKKSMENAEEGDRIYKSKWFGYKFFDFLKDREPLVKTRKYTANAKRKEDPFNTSENASDLCYNECTAFGKFLSTKLQKLNEQRRSFVMHRINNLIFEAEMELFSQKNDGYNSPSSSTSFTSEANPEFNDTKSQNPEY